MTVCLISKAKNEGHCIKRMLESVKKAAGGQLTYWVIQDTGSTDDTREAILETMEGIPGELIEEPWVSFGENNTLLLEAARGKAGWLVLVDADIELKGSFKDIDEQTADALQCPIVGGGLRWRLPLITRGSKEFHYVGAAHEYLASKRPIEYATFDSIEFHHHGDGRTSGSAQRNLDLLLGQKEYTPRDMFYIAQSYRDLGENEKALGWYREHVEVGDFIEEVFISKLRIGLIEQSVELLLEAWDYRPSRAEPLYEALKLLLQRKQYRTASALGEMALQIPYPKKDVLFIQDTVYKYDLLYIYSLCVDYVNRDKAIRAFREILGTDGIPDYVRDATRTNLSFALLNS